MPSLNWSTKVQVVYAPNVGMLVLRVADLVYCGVVIPKPVVVVDWHENEATILVAVIGLKIQISLIHIIDYDYVSIVMTVFPLHPSTHTHIDIISYLDHSTM